MFNFRRMTAVALMAVAPLLQTLPSHAESARNSDARHDALYYTWLDDETTDGSWGLDIKGLKVDYTTHRLTARLTFWSLGHHAFDDAEVVFSSPRGTFRYEVDVWHGSSGVYKGRYTSHRLCNVASHVDYRHDVIRMSAPASCVGAPSKVRPRAEVEWTYQEVSGSHCCDDEAWDWLPSGMGYLDYVHRGHS